jgi:hypothetical protein
VLTIGSPFYYFLEGACRNSIIGKEKEGIMSNLALWENVFRWAFMIVGGVLFIYGFSWGRWDAAVLGLLFIQFSMGTSIALSHKK